MAGPLEAGDLIAFARLAWMVYEYGFTEERSASRQYTEFGIDVRGLAENLNVLTDVVGRANESLQLQARYAARVRWDPASLKQIIGDYEATLQECWDLIATNQRYAMSKNMMRNIEWNVMVQPTADKLRQRILLHNSKVVQFLKPFEIDLLSRVRDDILRMHQDLASRIDAVHHNLQRFMGVLVPDLETELTTRAQRQIFLLDVPPPLAERFTFAALADRPDFSPDQSFDTGELSDAFMLQFGQSTKAFQGGVRVADRIPPVDQYLNLLKCVWLFDRLRREVPESSGDDSHWPSYVRHLEDVLSSECSRFKRDLVAPKFDMNVPRDMLSIWPEKAPEPLVPVVTRFEMMEQVLEAPLEREGTNIEREIKLLRRMGSDGRRYRILISGSEQTTTGKPRAQTEVIDFNLATAILNPHYAMPSSRGLNREIILQRDERVARLAFTSMKNVLKFQQAITGFKAWDSYCEYDVLVSFVVAGLKEPIDEICSLQLWIPKQVGGSIVTNEDAPSDSVGEPELARSRTMMTRASDERPSNPPNRGRASSSSILGRSIPPGGSNGRISDDIGPLDRTGRSPTLSSPTWPRQTSPGPMDGPWNTSGVAGRPMNSQTFSSMVSSTNAHRQSMPRKAVGSGGTPYRSSSAMANNNNNTGGNLGVPSPGPTRRALSVSSNTSMAISSDHSSSSGSASHTLTISTGSGSVGYLHQRPPKPRLVLFTQSMKERQNAFVAIEIDDETAINAEVCDCRRAGREGSSCRTTSLEQRKGTTNLDARRFETTRGQGDLDWNLARLAEKSDGLCAPSKSQGNTAWPGLKRVSFRFPTAEARARFGGMPNQCRCKNRNQGELKACLAAAHQGVLGEVREFYRLRVNKYHQQRFEDHQQVVQVER